MAIKTVGKFSLTDFETSGSKISDERVTDNRMNSFALSSNQFVIPHAQINHAPVSLKPNNVASDFHFASNRQLGSVQNRPLNSTLQQNNRLSISTSTAQSSSVVNNIEIASTKKIPSDEPVLTRHSIQSTASTRAVAVQPTCMVVHDDKHVRSSLHTSEEINNSIVSHKDHSILNRNICDHDLAVSKQGQRTDSTASECCQLRVSNTSSPSIAAVTTAKFALAAVGDNLQNRPIQWNNPQLGSKPSQRFNSAVSTNVLNANAVHSIGNIRQQSHRIINSNMQAVSCSDSGELVILPSNVHTSRLHHPSDAASLPSAAHSTRAGFQFKKLSVLNSPQIDSQPTLPPCSATLSLLVDKDLHGKTSTAFAGHSLCTFLFY